MQRVRAAALDVLEMEANIGDGASSKKARRDTICVGYARAGNNKGLEN